MLRILFLAFVAITVSPLSADEVAKIPANVQKHMKGMVGSWTFKGTEGDRKFFGKETIRLTNNQTALLQEGYFDLGNGEKEHYVILSGWDGDKKTMVVRGFTTDGYTWSGEWKTLNGSKWIGTASGTKATFDVSANRMRYEDASNGTPWISEFTRVR